MGQPLAVHILFRWFCDFSQFIRWNSFHFYKRTFHLVPESLFFSSSNSFNPNFIRSTGLYLYVPNILSQSMKMSEKLEPV